MNVKQGSVVSDSKVDRRKAPRLGKNIPVKLCQEGGDIVTETLNLSRLGAYCRVQKNLELMTKFNVQLLLPLKKGSRHITKRISCTGVVVRSEPEPQKDTFCVAIFFNDISPKDAQSISEFVQFHLNQPSI